MLAVTGFVSLTFRQELALETFCRPLTPNSCFNKHDKLICCGECHGEFVSPGSGFLRSSRLFLGLLGIIGAVDGGEGSFQGLWVRFGHCSLTFGIACLGWRLRGVHWLLNSGASLSQRTQGSVFALPLIIPASKA